MLTNFRMSKSVLLIEINVQIVVVKAEAAAHAKHVLILLGENISIRLAKQGNHILFGHLV